VRRELHRVDIDQRARLPASAASAFTSLIEPVQLLA
jgi:hypothetical protein